MKTARLLLGTLLAVAGLAVSAYGAGKFAVNPLGGVSMTVALNDAKLLAAHRADLKVLRVEGNSMLPFFGPGAVLVVKELATEKLRAGMVVVYTNRFNETVAHRLVGSSVAGWTASGYNNTEVDSTPVTAANLIGVVYATFHSDARPVDALAMASVQATPVALAASAR